MVDAYKKFWRYYINFSGTSNRADYWLAWLMNAIIYLIAMIVLGTYLSVVGIHGTYHAIFSPDGVAFNFQVSGIFLAIMLWVIGIYSLLIIIPSFAISIRRLRDAGFHWAFIFLNLLPSFGSIILLILHCLPTNIENTDILKERYHDDPGELEKWYRLKEKNMITQDEYDAKKKELL